MKVSVLALFAATVFAQIPAHVSMQPATLIPASAPAAKADVKRLSAAEFAEFRRSHPGVVVIDVRSTPELKNGSIPGAAHMLPDEVEKSMGGKVPKSLPLVLYCGTGEKAAKAADNLARSGYTRVYALQGGFAAYQAAGLPVTK